MAGTDAAWSAFRWLLAKRGGAMSKSRSSSWDQATPNRNPDKEREMQRPPERERPKPDRSYLAVLAEAFAEVPEEDGDTPIPEWPPLHDKPGRAE